MSNEDEIKAVGQMATRYGEAKKKLAIVQAETTRIGKALEAVGGALTAFADRVKIDGGTIYVTKQPGTYDQVGNYELSILDAEKIANLTNEHRELRQVINELEPQLRQLGVLPSERSQR